MLYAWRRCKVKKDSQEGPGGEGATTVKAKRERGNHLSIGRRDYCTNLQAKISLPYLRNSEEAKLLEWCMRGGIIEDEFWEICFMSV